MAELNSFSWCAWVEFVTSDWLLKVDKKVLLVVYIIQHCRVAEVAREHGWHPPRSLDSDENFKPEHTLFCHELRFVAIYALFGDHSVSWARSALLHSIYCIFY